MDLEIRFNGDDVSFNVNCVVTEDDEELAANDEMPIDELEEVDISNERIRRIPDSIGRLTELRLLCFADNELVSIPDSIGNLVNLELLDLDGNHLSSLPSMRRLTNLLQLTLANNLFTNFPTIRYLTSLKILNLSDNQITTIPPTIRYLTNLEDLDLRNNQLTTIPASIGELNLLELDLSENPITHIPATIGNSRLTTCILPDNILLDPLQDEYLFTNRVVMDEVRRVFDIRRYNDLMEANMENQNEIDRRPTRSYAKAATKYYASRAKTAKKRVFSNKKYITHLKGFINDIDIPAINPPSSKVLAKNEFRSHIMGMLGNRYIPKTTDEVIRLR